ncbi:pilus assembly protein PilZ, partial [Pseudoalteromonas sp. S1612]
GTVTWVPPQGAQSSTPPGIAISLLDDKTNRNAKSEKLRGTRVKSGNPTYTM